MGSKVVGIHVIALVPAMSTTPIENLFAIAVISGRSPSARRRNLARILKTNPLVDRQAFQRHFLSGAPARKLVWRFGNNHFPFRHRLWADTVDAGFQDTFGINAVAVRGTNRMQDVAGHSIAWL